MTRSRLLNACTTTAGVLTVTATLLACGGGKGGDGDAASAAATTAAAGTTTTTAAAATNKRIQAVTSTATLAVRLPETVDPLMQGLTIPADAATRGMWSPVQNWPMNAIHLAQLPDGRVLSYGAPINADAQNGRTYDVWDPLLGTGATSHASTYDAARLDSFCSTAAYLNDGRLLITGGNAPQGSSLYSPALQSVATDTFGLADTRWYASLIKLPGNRAVILGGIDPYTEPQQDNPDAAVANGQSSMTPELYTPGVGWRNLSGATSREAFGPDYLRSSYPHAWVAPSGKVFGISADTMWTLDVDAAGGLGAIQIHGRFKTPPGPNNPVNAGATSGAAMFAPGRVLVAGGNGSYNADPYPGSSAATVVDFNSGTPVLTETAPLNNPRRYGNMTVLPDATVVVTGGTRFGNQAGTSAVFAAELWRPATGQWTVGASASIVRVYHSNTLMLNNGTVLSAGGGSPGPVFNTNAEIYYPPYLFQADAAGARLATRPVVTAISALGFVHGGSGEVQLKTSAPIASAVLMGVGVATHTFNSGQRRVPLTFTQSGNRLAFDLPASAALAPHGYYHLVLLDAAGVPSSGVIVALGEGMVPPPTPPQGTGTGLLGQYFNTPDLSGNPVLQRTEGLNVDWADASPGAGVVADNFSVRWSGQLEAMESGSYRLRATSDDGMRVYVDGKLLIDNWRWQPATSVDSPAITLNAGQRVAIVVEYMDLGGQAVARLAWQRPGRAFEIVPTSQLYPAAYVAPTDVPPAAATSCASQGATCTPDLRSIVTVWYGAGSSWLSRSGVTGSIACSAEAFGGDPAPGASKTCRALVTGSIQPAADALACASEGGTCALPAGVVATVWYGSGSRWTLRNSQGGSVACSNAVFGDPAPGSAKACRYRTTAMVPLGAINAPPVRAGSAASWTTGFDNPALSFSWDFGDGSAATAFSASAAASHVYAQPGLYVVTLTTRNGSFSSATTFFQAVYAAPTAGTPRSSSNLLLEPASASRAARLWVANPDADTVSVIDTATNLRIAEITVGKRPRALARAADGRIWVASVEAASLAVIDPASLTVSRSIALPTASQPQGLVIGDDGSVYLSLEARGEVIKLSASGIPLGTASLGGTPRGLALSADGRRLLVSRFITAPLAGEATAAVNTASGGAEVWVLDTATLARVQTVTLGHSNVSDGENQGSGIPNYLAAPVISPDGRLAWVPSKQDNIGRGTLRNGLPLNFQNTVRAVSSPIDLATGLAATAQRVDHDNASVASAAVHDATGSYLFVALETARQVEVLNARTGRALMRIEAGLAPQGLAVSADNSRLYVHNFMGRSISVVDITPLTRQGKAASSLVATVASTAVEKLAAATLQGKRLFYDARDPRLARDSYMSCASCHADGGHDGRVWDFTGFGEGLRNTPSLRGRGGMAQGLVHWSGNFDEIQDFELQIRNFAGGTGLLPDSVLAVGSRSQPLGDPKAGLGADLDALAAYVSSLTATDASPLRLPDRSLTPAALAGRTVFADANCASCHGGSGFTASNGPSQLKSVGTIKPASGSRLGAPLTGIDPPTLRDVWATAPYLHDGSAPTLKAAVQAHASNTVSGVALDNLVAYLSQIGPEEPAVEPRPLGLGLRGSYFANESLAGAVVLQRTEAVNFNWGTAAPAAGLPSDRYSARWEGWIEAPVSGSYRFQTVSDDGVRLWIDGAPMIGNWTVHTATTDTSKPVVLAAGQKVRVVLEYQELTGNATIVLRWQLPGASSYGVIPAQRLYPL